MKLEDITEFIDKKILEDSSKIVIKYFELKVQNNLSNEELLATLSLIRTRLNNLGYKVFSTDNEYEYQGRRVVVKTNELLVGINEEV